MLGGFDFVNLDAEHGLFTQESADAMVRVADGYGLTTIMRVPEKSANFINLYLDRGVMGVMGPHVESAEEAKALVDACRFTPEGERSWAAEEALFTTTAV